MLLKAKKQLLFIEGKILLGLSGGPDSMCLCHLLNESGVDFSIAHVDHGIQKESLRERDRLQAYAKKINAPFHLSILDAALFPKSNLEEILRKKRISFFKKVMMDYSLDTLLLGHQQDEKAETMVKRFFEGGSLFNLSGITESSEYEGIKIRRPLLGVPKAKIIEFLEKEGIAFYTDPSNFSGSNLRAKMRTNLIPRLEEEFGKNIVSSICDLGEQVDEVSSYIEEKVKLLKGTQINGFFGYYYPYIDREDDYIYRLMLQESLKEKGISISRDHRGFIKVAVEQKIYGKNIPFAKYDLYFEKCGIFLVEKDKLQMKSLVSEEGLDWLEFWKKGPAHAFACEELQKLQEKRLDKKRLAEFFRINKVPVWMRHLFPIPLTTISKKIKINA